MLWLIDSSIIYQGSRYHERTHFRINISPWQIRFASYCVNIFLLGDICNSHIFIAVGRLAKEKIDGVKTSMIY